MHTGCTANTGRHQLHTHAYLPVAPHVLERWGATSRDLEHLLRPSSLLTVSESVQEHGVLEFAIAYRAWMGRCELNSRQTVVCRGRPVAGSQVFTGCQSAYCRWLLRHVAITIQGRRVIFHMVHKRVRVIYAAIGHGSLQGTRICSRGRIAEYMLMTRQAVTCKVVEPPFLIAYGHVTVCLHKNQWCSSVGRGPLPMLRRTRSRSTSDLLSFLRQVQFG